MAGSEHSIAMTELRRRYMRSRELDLAAQMQECADYLGNPEVLLGEFVDAYCAVENARPVEGVATASAERDEDPDELLLEYFFPSREIQVAADDPYGFTCLTSHFVPGGVAVEETEARVGLDYVGVIEQSGVSPVFGALQSVQDSSAYLLMLRVLTNFAELAPEAQLAQLNRELFKDQLGGLPQIDLHVVLWDLGEDAQTMPLNQLAHDLADVFCAKLQEEVLFPNVLRRIVCLRMNPDDFDGTLQVHWQV